MTTAEETATQREIDRMKPVDDYVTVVLAPDVVPTLTESERTMIAGNLRAFWAHVLATGGRIEVTPHAGRVGYDMVHDPVRDVVVIGGVPASTDVLRWILIEPNPKRWMRFERTAEKVLAFTLSGGETAGESAYEMLAELERAKRHGEKFESLHEAYAVILEELDEIWDITRRKRRDRDVEELRKEFVQLGAMALKALQSLDNFVGGSV